MLFHSSIRKELARSFGATLVVLATVVMTMTLIRTVGEASRGTFNPTDVMIIMGYTVLSDMPTILSMSMFIAILSVLTRMYKDSEMVIWFGSGRGLASLLNPLFRFAWPILVVIAVLAFLILPWAFGRIEDLRDRYEKRGDIARIEPGQFQESANGDRVFFIEKNSDNKQVGNNVFIATYEQGKETVTSARSGHIEIMGSDKMLVLENGQRLEKTSGKPELTVSMFERYGARVGGDDVSARSYIPASSLTTQELLGEPNPKNLAELSWRIGLVLAALNFIVIGIAAAGTNPRVGRTANLGFAFLIFVAYFNFLVLGKSWVESGQVQFGPYLLVLHGGALVLSLLWLAKRNNNWVLRLRKRATSPGEAKA
ncbi:LPS export ABC transporter permease LptF [Rhodoferax lacus]|uniref:Lipopolysaccharide export system permease protein LptF n=1 Tax=Rhodoferax lacus TaxID=2184758 RepID=A0A3E1RGV5_9BURK|nr:LPS export ABC transporter permease LptF [Rhodoferax lacus]RFO98589.1 LPS export ABC transporter permease LptF [Rhodoferax lacus]